MQKMLPLFARHFTSAAHSHRSSGVAEPFSSIASVVRVLLLVLDARILCNNACIGKASITKSRLSAHGTTLSMNVFNAMYRHATVKSNGSTGYSGTLNGLAAFGHCRRRTTTHTPSKP
jgi:hypothetical protein